MFRGVNQQNIFEEKEDYTKLITIISDIRKEMGFEIYAYCFMTNHVHIVIKENGYKEVSLIMKRILTKYARWYNIKYKRTGALIANRYKSVPVEIDEYFLHLIRYVHQNPIKAGMVDSLSDYVYSSYNEYLSAPVLVDTDLVLEMIDKKEFEDFHAIIEDISFSVSDRKGKSDDEMVFEIKNLYGIDNPKEIAKLERNRRNEIISSLKKQYHARQIQRITDVSRGIISRID